ncbi:hypothetical protein NPIL_396951 [Nephila pilipes]|uniref:Uncharacterized protein n=1 Tax=Nephila pilipes TaxID=299642 RepID=A0A8X6PND1_NEPPI|nr:hypothetical protein NPIL_396951 [Nephila pilipes]
MVKGYFRFPPNWQIPVSKIGTALLFPNPGGTFENAPENATFKIRRLLLIFRSPFEAVMLLLMVIRSPHGRYSAWIRRFIMN